MPRRPRTPKYGRHKATGQARVLIDGEHHYLGPYDSPESKRRYGELVDRWRLRQQAGLFPSLTLGQLALLYVEHATTYYQKDGRPTSEIASIRTALKPLMAAFRSLDVADFGPAKLRQYREHLVDGSRTRGTINQYVGRVVRMLRWAVSQEFCAPSVLLALESVQGLRKGRSKARESRGVDPVDPEDVAAIEDHIARPLWGAIQFQLHTAARPGESLILRGCDLNMSDDVWVYTPASHKTEHHGKHREVLIGPKAQAVISEYLSADLQAYLFGVPGTDRPYKRHSYTVAVRRTCGRAGVSVWKPNQLRHTAATRIRGAANVETAKTVLGHSDIRVSEIYAERDIAEARAVVAKIG